MFKKLKQLLCMLLGIESLCYPAQWTNWAQNRHCKAQILTPQNIPELIEIIKKAKKEKNTIRAYGSSHSWSDIVCTHGYLINTDKLNNIVSVDSDTHQVTVQAGIKLYDLNEKLAKLNLCLSNQGAITKQSLAGVVSTATHGSGKTGTFASFITHVKLLTADGNILTISPTHNSHLWNAVRTSIGSLGIMIELTVQCEPLFKVRQEIKNTDWKHIIKEYETLLHDNDYMQFSWSASDDSVEVLIHNRINPSRDTNNRVGGPEEKNNEKNNGNVDYSYKLLSGVLEHIYIEEEIAIPKNKFIEAANAARELVKKDYKKNGMFSGILFRFVAAEQHNLLSPAADQDVVYFSITTSSRKGYEKFFQNYYTAMLKYNGRPHWGKINYLNKQDTHTLYGKNFEQFIAIRKKLDPQGLFSNAFTKRIFEW